MACSQKLSALQTVKGRNRNIMDIKFWHLTVEGQCKWHQRCHYVVFTYCRYKKIVYSVPSTEGEQWNLLWLVVVHTVYNWDSNNHTEHNTSAFRNCKLTMHIFLKAFAKNNIESSLYKYYTIKGKQVKHIFLIMFFYFLVEECFK